MPAFVKAHPWLAEVVTLAGGQIVRVGSKPWAYFHGEDAIERAKPVEVVYEQIHGYKRNGSKPWREDQQFDYAIRLD